MVRESLPITPSVLSWAFARSGHSLDDMKADFKDFDTWLAGEGAPTYAQLEHLADKLKLPVAAFFFPEPPKLAPIRESFRTLPDLEYSHLPPNVIRMLHKAKAMQLNLAELNDGRNPSPRLLMRDVRPQPRETIERLADRVRRYLDITIEVQRSWQTIDVAMEQWRKIVVGAGIFVFKDAFRETDYAGFCLFDDEFPIVYINNSASKSRQIFTLFHELAHILFHTSGIDTESGALVERLPADSKRIEVWCNRFAARLLVPEQELLRYLSGRPIDRGLASELSSQFHVSREVIYRRFLDMGRVTQAEYEMAVQAWRAPAAQGAAKSSGGDYYNTQLAYLGSEYVTLAFQRFYQNRIDSVQLADYLNIAPKNLAALEDRFSRRKA